MNSLPLTLAVVVGVGGGFRHSLKKKRLGPPAVNKVDSLTDGLNDRGAN